MAPNRKNVVTDFQGLLCLPIGKPQQSIIIDTKEETNNF